MAAGEEVSLYLPWSSSIDLYLKDHFLPGETFLLLALERYARGGLCVVRLLYHPTGAREGGDR